MGFFDDTAALPTAIFSQDRCYRYLLRRFWDDALPPLPIVMYNPSTGDDRANDPTIRACIAIAQRRKFGSLVIANLHAFVTSSPRFLRQQVDPFGPDNSVHLRSLIALAVDTGSPILCAWGANLVVSNADISFTRRARTHKARTVCLGYSSRSAPRHPLFVARSTPFEEYIM